MSGANSLGGVGFGYLRTDQREPSVQLKQNGNAWEVTEEASDPKDKRNIIVAAFLHRDDAEFFVKSLLWRRNEL